MSLLFLLILTCTCAGSYGGHTYEVCYGSDFTVSLADMRLLGGGRELFFLPSTPFHRNSDIISYVHLEEGIPVVTENGTTLDPHYEISSDKFTIRDVTERDEGYIATKAPLKNNKLPFRITVFRLRVKDCLSKVTKEFGSDYYFKGPYNAYSLEFTPLNTNGSQSQVLWNRTDPQAGQAGVRGRLMDGKWTMNKLTYEYNGYYTFRDHNHNMVSRFRMQIQEQYQYFLDKDQGQDLRIMLGMDPALFHMTFQADHSQRKVRVMTAGELHWESKVIRMKDKVFQGRMQKLDGPTLQITIQDLQPSDSGRYEFRDQRGNLAFVVILEVKEGYPSYLRYIGVAVGILALVICCCYVRNRCCKTTRKNHSVPDTEAAPDVPVYYHDDNTQPSTSAHPTPSPSHGPTYSYPLHPQEPASTYQPPLATTTGSQDKYMDDPPTYDSLFSPGAAEPPSEPSAPPLSSTSDEP